MKDFGDDEFFDLQLAGRVIRDSNKTEGAVRDESNTKRDLIRMPYVRAARRIYWPRLRDFARWSQLNDVEDNPAPTPGTEHCL